VSKVAATITLPAVLVSEFIQHLRDFDTSHIEESTTNIQINAPELSANDVNTILDHIRPPFGYRTTIADKEGHHFRSTVRG
jgi:hypothetical protein